MKTHITFVLDSSGSMAKIEADTIGGFNSFLEDQAEEKGEATVSLYELNTTVERVYRGRRIEDAPSLDARTYSPSGKTALYDAISRAIVETRDWIESLPASDQPDHVVMVILTDGKENASETPGEQVRELIEEQQQSDNWEFLFIGANQDAALTAQEMGIDRDRSLEMNHSGEGTRAAYESTSKRISEARRHGSTGGYDESDRRRQSEIDES